MRRQNVLDFCQGFLAEIRRFQQFNLSALHQVTDVEDAFGLQAVCRPHRQLQVIDRAQQDWVDFLFFFFNFNRWFRYRGSVCPGQYAVQRVLRRPNTRLF